MNRLSTIRRTFGWLLTLVSLLLAGLPADSWAVQPESIAIAALDPAGGGSEQLIDALSAIEGLEVHDQTWFLAKINERGFKPQGIMKRPDDIKWLMDGANLDYIVYLAPDGDDGYEGRIVGPKSGTTIDTFAADRTSDGLSKAGAQAVANHIQTYLDDQLDDGSNDADTGAHVAALDDLDGPGAVKQRASETQNAAMQAFSDNWLVADIRGHMLRRDVQVSGDNQGLLSYTSAFYPGFSIALHAFPLGMTDPEHAAIGFYADYTQGFDSVGIADAAGGQTSKSISHLDFSGGLLYQLGDPLALKSSDQAKLQLSIGGRHTNYSVAENTELPTISHTSLVLGARATQPVLADNFSIRAAATISPWGIYGAGAKLFGQSAHTYGFGAGLSGRLRLTDDVGLTIGYDFQMQRTLFNGQGEAEFTNANVFELVQGFNGGLFYRY